MKTQLEHAGTIEQQYPILFDADIGAGKLGDALAANVGDLDDSASGDLDRITMPAAGALTWTVPGLEGDETTPELRGIIAAWRDTRAYWATPFGADAAKAPPQCSSLDGITGAGEPGGACRACPQARWGSSPGGTAAQACRLVRQMYVLLPGMSLPVVVLLPPSSVAAARRYLLRLAGRNLPHYEVITRITLARESSSTGIKYSSAQFAQADRLTLDQCRAVRAYIHALQPLLARQPLVAEEPE